MAGSLLPTAQAQALQVTMNLRKMAEIWCACIWRVSSELMRSLHAPCMLAGVDGTSTSGASALAIGEI
jgi:hypothetical protein